MKRAALFDLDRTLVRVNTGPLYVRWRMRQKQMGVRDLLRASWWTLQYTFRVIDADAVSRAAARSLTGMDEEAFRRECAAWVQGEVLAYVTTAARAEVERHQTAGSSARSSPAPRPTWPIRSPRTSASSTCSRAAWRCAADASPAR
ncbi:MAG: haloacid dehalogenase-like hydrolase [Sandaracinaceae bacterium]|nr:haloacid dehalogenase-like hydrolase [Sandaracinaceae bacterium]